MYLPRYMLSAKQDKRWQVSLPWTNAVDIDALAGPLVAHCLCHLQHASLGTRVCRDVHVCDERDDGSNVDDFARPLQLEKFLAYFLGGNKGCFQIDCKHLLIVACQYLDGYGPLFLAHSSTSESSIRTYQIYVLILEVFNVTSLIDSSTVE